MPAAAPVPNVLSHSPRSPGEPGDAGARSPSDRTDRFEGDQRTRLSLLARPVIRGSSTNSGATRRCEAPMLARHCEALKTAKRQRPRLVRAKVAPAAQGKADRHRVQWRPRSSPMTRYPRGTNRRPTPRAASDAATRHRQGPSGSHARGRCDRIPESARFRMRGDGVSADSARPFAECRSSPRKQPEIAGDFRARTRHERRRPTGTAGP